MKTYETCATVEEHRQLMLAGVPFEPGTHVEVTVTPTKASVESPEAKDFDRAARLLAALDKARNCETVGLLKRGEICDRDLLH